MGAFMHGSSGMPVKNLGKKLLKALEMSDPGMIK